MPSFWSFLISPFVLLFSFPLLYFAIFTSFIAFLTLLVRVLIVYIELAAAVIHDHLVSPPPRKASLPTSPALTPNVRDSKSRRSSVISFQSTTTGSTTPKIQDGQFPPGIYPSQAPLTRDFEGVGGWRFAGPDSSEDDSLWTTMNSRLELPTPPAIALPNPTNNYSVESFATLDTTKGSEQQKKRHVRRRASGSLNNVPLVSAPVVSGPTKATKTSEGRSKNRSERELIGSLGEVLCGSNGSIESLVSVRSGSRSMTSLGEMSGLGVNLGRQRSQGRRGERRMTSNKETETLK